MGVKKERARMAWREREREGERRVNEGQRGKEQERDRMRGWWRDAE